MHLEDLYEQCSPITEYMASFAGSRWAGGLIWRIRRYVLRPSSPYGCGWSGVPACSTQSSTDVLRGPGEREITEAV